MPNHSHTHTPSQSLVCACGNSLPQRITSAASLPGFCKLQTCRNQEVKQQKWCAVAECYTQSNHSHTRTRATGKVCVSEEIGLLHSTFHHICRTHTVTLIIWTLAIHFHLLTYILTHTLAIYSRNTGIARWPWTFLLHLFINRASWDRPKLLSLTQVLFGWCLSCSISLHCHTAFDPIGIILTFNMSKPSKSTFLDNHTLWFQFQQPEVITTYSAYS